MSSTPTCGACGASVQARFRVPPAESAPDLDFRPGEPARSTLPRWIQVCPGCGAAAADLTGRRPDAAEMVRSQTYRACAGSTETLPFRRWALLCSDPAEATIQAAWAADDAGLVQEATALRRDVAALWAATTELAYACRRLDVLRRAGEFAAAERWLSDIGGWAKDDVTSAVLAFQRARVREGDSGRYLLSAALRPPAHAPHVSHGKQRTGGLLSRLLRR